MRKLIASIVSAALWIGPAVALEGTIYDCAFKVSSNELLSDRVVFVVSPDESKSRVYDGVIHFVDGEPVDAKVIENTGKKIRIRWSVMFPFRGGVTARVDFRVSYTKGNKSATMSSQAMGFTNQYNARGKCAVSKGQL